MRVINVGDIICLRDDLIEDNNYGDESFCKGMKSGSIEKISSIHTKNNLFYIEKDIIWLYSVDMIDWEKTDRMRKSIKYKDRRKIIMPELFDEWVKGYSGSSGTQLVYVLVSDHMECELDEDMEKLFEDREEDCYRALLDDYEVKKEKLYTVDCGGGKGLVSLNGGKIYLASNYKVWEDSEKQLTQLEIENSEHSILMAIAKEVVDE